MQGTGENMDGGLGFHSIGEAERARNQSYPLTIRMEGATEDEQSCERVVL